MYLVLGPPDDPSALWAYQGLEARGLEPLEWVSSEMLVGAERWEHRLGAQGVSLEVTLADGRTIHSDAIRGVFNRLKSVPTEGLLSAHPADHDYAAQELAAFFLSWLNALPPPVLNRPTPEGLSGAWRHRPEWMYLAQRAGLPTSRYRQSNRAAPDPSGGYGRLVPPSTPAETVLVLADHVIGTPLSPDLQNGCRRLARLAHTALLGIEFAAGPPGCPWTFAGATPVPDLRLGGKALLDALAAVLVGCEGVG
jgi:hypothetical protein